jgi:aspartate racemase
VKTLGIIGGIGPESTIAYYRLLVDACRQRKQEPAVIINSIAMDKMLGLVADGKLAELADYLSDEIGKLADAGAALGLLAANTPHVVFDELRSRAPIPLVSIVEAACEAARSRGLQRLALFGTRFTMQARFYPDLFSRAGIDIVLPSDGEQAFIHHKYMAELIHGRVLAQTRDALNAIIERLRRDESIRGVILGGTELPLVLCGEDHDGIALLDTAKIHVEYALRRLLPH